MLNKIKFILVSLFAVCIAVSAFALPETFLIYGFVNNSNGAAVLNPDVTITNLNTSEVFTTEVDDNYYQVSTSSRSVSTGNTLHFTVRDNGNIVGRDHTVTDEDINNGGLFNFNVTSESAEMSQFFDTGEAANPYPSISGIHNGTITPKVTIRNLSRLYTYPCPGTGGHTEYVAFWHSNGTRITEGLWNGYTDDDWHNISFPAFTMHADDTYKYSIRTGSYPQIIHNQTHTNGYGTINCTEFTDANGRSYTDRIPAIRLEAYFVPAAAGYTNPKSAFSSHYDPVNITADPCVPSYDLPITNLTKITNYQDIMSVFGPSALNNTPFRTNGFVIRDYGDVRDIVAPYEDMKAQDIPIFVTADTLLHLYHIQFNEILKGIEEREFFDSLVDTSNAMLEQSKTDYETFDDQEMKEAARRNVAYFSVALTLLQTSTEGYNSRENIKEVSFTIPDYVKDEVDTEIENIEGHEGFKPSVVFNTNPNCVCGYPCCYCEDYSQYVPRGHYTRSEKLKRYFKAMMWYGRMAFLLKGCNGDEALISGQDANTSTIQAALISSELPEVKVGTKTAQDTWNRIYAVTAFFVGNADDLTPYEYANAMNNVFGADYNLSELSDEANLLTLKAELAKMRSPEIYGGSGVCVVYPPITEEKLYECLDKTKGMRFMGQRFVPDSYMFQHLVSPAVGMYVGNDTPFTMCITDLGTARCFPRGLDVMAVLGSERAEDILREEGDTEYESIITNDGRLLFPQGIDIVKLKDMEQQQEAENRSRAQKEQKRTIGNFIVSSDEICREDGKPIIYFFCSDACGHCKWEHPVIVNVTSNFEGYISFHDNMNSDEDSEIFSKYSTGGVPTLVLGCKYYRVGSGANMGKKQEARVLTTLICDLTYNKPADVCSNNTSYDIQLNNLKSEFADVDIAEWNQNLYWSWLYTLKSLLNEFGNGYPTFMQTEAWQNKGLQTSLASWTELRHDTILYAKQSYTPPMMSVPPQVVVVGYVEPVPGFYARLLSLTKMTENGLEDRDALNETEKARLQSLECILERLINISVDELENKELSEADYTFISNFGESLDATIEGVSEKGKETTIVADVHTDCNTGKVLEEGVGYVKLILVAYKVPDGRIIVGAGPVFSYYEFKQPMENRLTDENWKEMLQTNPPEEPDWVKGIMG